MTERKEGTGGQVHMEDMLDPTRPACCPRSSILQNGYDLTRNPELATCGRKGCVEAKRKARERRDQQRRW